MFVNDWYTRTYKIR